jgi:hypothetical protein
MGGYYLYIAMLCIDEQAIIIDEQVIMACARSSTNTFGWSKSF